MKDFDDFDFSDPDAPTGAAIVWGFFATCIALGAAIGWWLA